jgi:hypothetical protein
LHQEKNAFEVNVHNRIEVRLGYFLEVDMLGITRAIYEVIKSFACPASQCLADIRNETVECS